MRKRLHGSLSLFLILILTPVFLLALSGCAPLGKKNRPNRPPPEPMPYHESWCYETLGHADCYVSPQAVEPGTLINVDPPSRYPLTPEEYRKLLGGER